jgi:chemotaxis response regulator CheB
MTQKLANVDRKPLATPVRNGSAKRPLMVAIGASAGGPAALAALLQELPADYPAFVAIIQHLDERFAAGMADWLCQQSRMPVRLARESDRPSRGAVLLAGGSDHLVFKKSDRLGYVAEPRELAYRPSINVFFHSVNALWLGDVVGVLLTGMGKDGAEGLGALRARGHYTIAQDQTSSAVYGMPKAAAAANAAVEILPLQKIASRLIALAQKGRYSEIQS